MLSLWIKNQPSISRIIKELHSVALNILYLKEKKSAEFHFFLENTNLL